jgi:AcrR family transcriptional regulator
MTHIQKRNPQQTRDRLVRAALDLFTTRGYHASTTPEIAARAGVAEGTIYRHFESKQHLLNEIYRAAVRLLLKAPQASVSGSCRERLAAVAEQWRDVAARDPALIKLVFFTDLEGLLDAKSREIKTELTQALTRIIASGKAAGEVRAGAADVWAEVWLALTVLTLGRIAAREWPATAPAVVQVRDAALEALRVREAPPDVRTL